MKAITIKLIKNASIDKICFLVTLILSFCFCLIKGIPNLNYIYNFGLS